MTRRLLVIGGDAAGMSAASGTKRRLGDDVEVVVLERGSWTSYSACGIPYWVAGQVDGPQALVDRSPEEHRQRGIDVRMGSEALSIDPDAGTVEVRDAEGVTSSEPYDDLLVATGAEPVRPPLPGIDADGIYGVQSLDDGCRLLDALGRGVRRVVVVGSGYIGVEMAEACLDRGLDVTVVDQAEAPMTLLDTELGAQVHVAMEGLGMTVRMGTEVKGFETDDAGYVRAVETGAGRFDADLVILGLGVKPRAQLLSDAGLTVGELGGARTDEHQRVDVDRHVWAAGDCAESRNRLTGDWVHVPLGTHANKQGWVVGRNVGAADTDLQSFPGVVGTAITKVCNLEIGLTGLNEAAAAAAGFDAYAVTIESSTKVGYFPGVEEMTVKMVAEVGTRRILGAQIVGRGGAAKRIDTAATALWAGLTVDDVHLSDLSYAPPFSPTYDPVQVAARVLASSLGY